MELNRTSLDQKNEVLLNRLHWLRFHGFVQDPFPVEAFRAETDPLFERPGLPAFVDPPNYREIKGEPGRPGYRFIFASSGAGKTSLRRRLKRQFDNSLALNLSGEPTVLAVEYVDHEYAPEDADAQFHIRRILDLIKKEYKRWSLDWPDVSTDASLYSVLRNVAVASRDHGLDGICVLVDNLDIAGDRRQQTASRRIEALAVREDLLTVAGWMFKLMLPAEEFPWALKSLPLGEFPPCIMIWDRQSLREMLYRRLVACMDESLRDVRFSEDRMPGIEGEEDVVPLTQLCDKQLGQTIGVELVNYGWDKKQPRAMWKLGYYLLDEHFSQSPYDYRRFSADLIQHAALLGAWDRIISIP